MENAIVGKIHGSNYNECVRGITSSDEELMTSMDRVWAINEVKRVLKKNSSKKFSKKKKIIKKFFKKFFKIFF